MKALATLILIVATLGIAWFTLKSPEGSRDPSLQVRPTADSSTPGDVEALQGDRSASEANARRSIDARPAEAQSANASSTADPPAETWLGTVELRLPDGTVETDVDGELGLSLWSGNTGQQVRLPVEAGRVRFAPEARTPSAVEAQITHGELSGRSARARSSDRVNWSRDLAAHFVLELRPSLTLDVRDKLTGRSLGDVDVRVGLNSGLDQLPGERTYPWGGRAPSPRQLDRSDLPSFLKGFPSLTLHVGATGYAWRRVEAATEGVQIVELRPGGDLELEFEGLPVPNDLDLRLVAGAPGRPAYRGSLGGEAARRFSGLGVCPLIATVQRGGPFGPSVDFGEVEGEIRPGETTRLRLAIDPAVNAEPGKFDVQFVLHLPEGWGTESRSASLESIGSSTGR